MSVSIKDIAVKAKVSPSTVSRALKDHPRIGLETRVAIQKLAKTMGYVPNEAARRLVEQRSLSIGVTIHDLTDLFHTEITKGIEEAATKHGYQILMSSHHKDAQQELQMIQSFHEKRMDGIIVTFSSAYQSYLNNSNFFIPIVVINRPNYPISVSTDRVKGARVLMEHLIELGHKRIAYIRGPEIEEEGNTDRFKAYQAVLKEHALPFDPKLIIPGGDTTECGLKAVPQILELSERPTAIFAFNDPVAIGVIHALRQHGYEVPNDFSVAGYDDLEMAKYYHPTLTTVKQPRYELGYHAFKLLLSCMQGKKTSREIIEPELMVRESTAAISRSKKPTFTKEVDRKSKSLVDGEFSSV